MINKTTVACIILASNSSFALSDLTPYLGGSLGTHNFESHSDVIGNVFGGYGKRVGTNNKFYLGGEGNVYYNAEQIKYGVGLSFIPGIMISDSTMLYGRIGLDTAFTSHHDEVFSFGTKVGAGVQTNVAKNWDVRAEYATSAAQHGGESSLGLVYNFT